MAAKKIIMLLIAFTTTIYIGFIFLDNLSWTLVICGLVAQAVHFVIMKDFPYVRVTSVPFIAAVVLVFVQHGLAFRFFAQHFYHFSEILAFFTLCQWLVPFALFVSLSANDQVLPTTTSSSERTPLLGESHDHNNQPLVILIRIPHSRRQRRSNKLFLE